MCKIISIEGIDGSGKETQAKLLKERLNNLGWEAEVYSFPNYDSNSFAIKGIREILDGSIEKYRKDFMDNTYAISSIYALDRFLSIEKILGKNKNNKDNKRIVIFDRYVESNMCYQSAKMYKKNIDKKDILQRAKWIYDLEYNRFKLPKPDLTLFINISAESSEKLRKNREFKSGTSKDIYEENFSFLKKIEEISIFLSKEFNWKKIDCSDDEHNISPIEEIADNIWKEVELIL